MELICFVSIHIIIMIYCYICSLVLFVFSVEQTKAHTTPWLSMHYYTPASFFNCMGKHMQYILVGHRMAGSCCSKTIIWELSAEYVSRCCGKSSKRTEIVLMIASYGSVHIGVNILCIPSTT